MFHHAWDRGLCISVQRLHTSQHLSLYERNNPGSLKFLCATWPVNCIFDLNLNAEPVMVTSSNGTDYCVQALVHLLNEDESATKEEMIDFLK